MATLPQIKYTSGVQSLGREDISAPGRKARARAQAASEVVAGLEEFERTVAATEYTKQMSSARNSIADLYDTVTSKESYTSSEIPEYISGIERYEEVPDADGQMIVRERIIPASEIRAKWFEQGLQNITNASVKGSKTIIARKRISQELRTSIGPAAYNQLLTYNRAAMKKENLAIMDASIQEAVINGDRLGMEETLFRFLASGEISKADYETRKLKASQDLDIEAYTSGIFESEDLSDLEEVESQIDVNLSLTKPGEEPSDMTPAQRRSLRASITNQRSALERVRKETYTENEQEGTALALSGELTDAWLIDMAINDGLEGSAIRALDNMRDQGSSGSVVRSAVVADQKRAIQRALYFPEFGQQVSNLTQEVKNGLIRNEHLNGAEIDQLMAYANTVEKQIRDNPEYKTALVTMRGAVGLPEDELAYENLQFSMDPNAVLARKAYADFQKSLFNYIDEFGVEANVLEFVERNKERFDYLANPEMRDNVKHKVEQSRFKGYALGPLFDSDVIMKNAYVDHLQGKRTDEDMFDLWNILYGDAVDMAFFEGL